MTNEFRETRMFHLLMGKLLTLCPDLIVRNSQLPLCDYVAESASNSISFGFNIRSSNYEQTARYKKNIDTILQTNYEEQCNQLSIILFTVNETKELISCSIQLLWRFSQPILFEKLYKKPLNEDNWRNIVKLIQASDSYINLLYESDCFIKRMIEVKWQDGEENKYGTIIYLRKISNTYHINPLQRETNAAHFDFLVNGYSENEFPNDILDDKILYMIDQSFTIVKKGVDMMLFNTDLLDVQRYRRCNVKTFQIVFSPEIPLELMPLFNGIELPQCKIELYTYDHVDADEVKSCSVELKMFKEISQLTGSCTVLSKYFE